MRMWRNWQTRRFQVPVGDRMGSSPFIRTKISDFKRFLARNRLFFCLFIVIIYALRGMNGEYFTIHSTYYLLYEGKILKTGTAEELANDEMVRRVYLGKNFELKKNHKFELAEE